jgi:PKD repeat protein
MLKRFKGKSVSACLVLILFFCSNAKAVTASLTADQTIGCTPLTVQFTSTSTNAVSWHWDLGNGNSSTLPNPANIYTTPGSYNITLVAYDSQGNSDSITYINYITVVQRPSAGFNSNANSGCPDNNSFIFSNTSTGANTYLWDFGDGTTSNNPNPVHSYSYAGTFTITLIASNSYGCQDVKTRNQYITVFPKPDPAIIAPLTSDCNSTHPYQFYNNATNGQSWTWYFGDMTSSALQNPVHVYSQPGKYPVYLVVANIFGCTDTSDTPTEINVGIDNAADFTTDVDTGCAPLIVQFTSPNLTAVTTYWDFGDGNNSISGNPSHNYMTGGTYSVSYIVSDAMGCADTITKSNLINAGSKPTVDFTYSDSIGCAPKTIQFTNHSTNFTTCTWYFGDGTTSNAVNPSHNYTNGGNFTVTLTCDGTSGCSTTLVKSNIITVTAPNAIFSASPRVGCPPLASSFTALAPSAGLTYNWTFGDGATSVSQNPSHTFTSTGTYDVKLIVTDSLGCKSTLIKTGYIQAGSSGAAYTPPPPTSGCSPLSAQFNDNTPGATSWLWNFGDGNSSNLQNPSHTYTSNGIYTVSLTTSNGGAGCPQIISNFNTFIVDGGYAGFIHHDSPCPPYISSFQDTSMNAVSWLWDFGDGTTDTTQDPTHEYLTPGYHSVSLTITTANGCTFTTMQSNGVYFAPFGANFYGIPLDTIFPCPVQFMANSVGATSWLWDFGDSTTSTQENPLHNFAYYGFFNVTLRISNGTCSMLYTPPPFHFGPPDTTGVSTGNTGLEVQQGCIPLNVLFTNHTPATVSWLWDFGDGQTSNSEFPTHLYMNPGFYTVTLTTTDSTGLQQFVQMDSIVHASGPTAGFILQQNIICNNMQVVLNDTSHNATTWLWDLGDGTTSSSRNFSHVYTTYQSNYIITQTVSDTMGCSATIAASIFSSPVAPVFASENEICGMDTVHFVTTLTNNQNYHWDFGDGTSSNQMNPSHVYAAEGTYTPVLTVTDPSGCAQAFNLTPPINVKLPAAAFTSTGQRQACNQTHIDFINQSQHAVTYLWNLGDGNTSTLASPSHDYNLAGRYDVTLTVYNGSCVSTVTMPNYIRVDTSHAGISLNTDKICLPITATFTDLSSNAVSWIWSFGDGDSSTIQNPVHVYNDRPAGYPVLIITDINGCSDTAAITSFSVLKAGYTTSVDSGCFPLPVNFTSTSSVITSTWEWHFGDGSTSTAQNPSHTYSQPGNYDVTLIVTSVYANCIDTLYIPQKIRVKQPHADFTSNNLAACAPSVVNFTNLSTDGDTYFWDFGDGSTSTNVNPSHIYNVPGIFTVRLVANSQLGCSDTLTRMNYIQVLGSIANFSASTTSGCQPLIVSFTDSSTNAVHYTWNFGDGYADSVMNPVHVYEDTGSYKVSLVTSDSAGCVSFYEMLPRVNVRSAPNASFTINTSGGCQPLSAQLTNTSTNAQLNTWYFGDGDTSTVVSPAHTYSNSGTYYPMLICTNASGCIDTAISIQPIDVLPAPTASFNINDTIGCAPFHITFNNTTINAMNALYLWDFGNGNTSTDPAAAADYNYSGSYTISLTVTNSSGCSSTISYPYTIHVLDSTPPGITNILSVSVLDNTSVKIIWENNHSPNLSAFILYRLDPNNIFQPVQYINANNNGAPFQYIDTGLNTLINTYTYKVQPVNLCGAVSPLDSLTAHTTINVSSVLQPGNSVSVSWTAYGGCAVSSYQVFRSDDNGPFTLLTTVPATSLSFLDTTIICPNPVSYKIMATDLCGNTYTSYSDTSVTIPENFLDSQVVDVVRSTVVDNLTVLTEWLQPSIHPELITQYDLYRSTDNENYYFIATVPALQTDYMDYNVDVQTNRYYYKILPVNICNVISDISEFTNTVLLKGEMDESSVVHLNWTPYEGWANGVDYYVIEKKDPNGNWQLLKQVSGTTLEYDFPEW